MDQEQSATGNEYEEFEELVLQEDDDVRRLCARFGTSGR